MMMDYVVAVSRLRVVRGFPATIAMTFDCSIKTRERQETGFSVFGATKD